MYRHIVFDIDGTLIDTETISLRSLHDAILEVMGEDRPLESLMYYFSVPSAKVGGMLGASDEQLFIDTWNRKWDELKPEILPFDGALDLVRMAHEMGMTVGCVTSRTRPELYDDYVLESVLDCFDVFVLADDTERHKPYPDPMLLFMERTAQKTGEPVAPQECIFIGDTKADCGCAQSAGAHFALADWNSRGNQGMEPEYRFEKVSDFADFLRANAAGR